MYSIKQQQQLLKIARESIAHGLKTATPSMPSEALPSEFQEHRATFVTLEIKGQLRGCIGMLEPLRPLAEDVAENAFAAAFQDSRFPPLASREFSALEISISILSPPEPLSFSSEEDLLKQIRPEIDGLILQEGLHRGTFLPAVWDQLPNTKTFFEHLKQKAGLPLGYWSNTLRISRYTAEYIQERL